VVLDLWRDSKGHNKKSVTKTYIDLNLLEKDGVHPKPLLARIWMRRIGTKVYEDCSLTIYRMLASAFVAEKFNIQTVFTCDLPLDIISLTVSQKYRLAQCIHVTYLS
jgi:hypothetical protein